MFAITVDEPTLIYHSHRSLLKPEFNAPSLEVNYQILQHQTDNAKISVKDFHRWLPNSPYSISLGLYILVYGIEVSRKNQFRLREKRR